MNPDMFAELFLPELDELDELSRRYGGLGMHCCADARRHWEGWAQIPDLQLLNIVHKQPVVEEAYDFFAGRVPQMHSWRGDGHPRTRHYPEGSRVVISASADSAEDAKRLAQEMARICR